MTSLIGRIRRALTSRQLPYAFPRVYNLVVYRGILPWLGMGSEAQTAFVAGTIRREGRLLEAPIGIGTLTMELYAQRPAVQVIGLDLSRPMLQAAQRQLRQRGIVNVQLVCADMTVLPFANDTFDQIVTLNGLHVLPHYEMAVDEFLRVAEDGAAIVGTTGVAVSDDPRGELLKLLARLGWIKPLDVDKVHELLGLTWSKLTAQSTGVVYAFRRPKLDRATGEVVE